MNIDSTVVFRYILPLYDHPIVCDWAKIMSKIGRKFAAFCRSHRSKLASAAAAKCGWAPTPKVNLGKYYWISARSLNPIIYCPSDPGFRIFLPHNEMMKYNHVIISSSINIP